MILDRLINPFGLCRRSEVLALQEQSDGLTREAEFLRRSVEAWKSNYEELEARHRRVVAESALLAEQLDDTKELASELAETKELLRVERVTVRSLREQIAILEADVAERRGAVAHLAVQLDSAEAALERSNAEAQSIVTERDRLAAEVLRLADVERELAELRASLEPKQKSLPLALGEEDESDEEVTESETDEGLVLLGTWFEERKRKWTFRRAKLQFKAVIVDGDFLDKVDQAEVAFVRGDVFHCRLRAVSTRHGDDETVVYTILKVYDVIHPDVQMPLILANDPTARRRVAELMASSTTH